MQYRRFGKTGWKISEIGFGCWGMGGNWGPRSDEKARAALRKALQLGVNFFDTAYVYGDGHSERILGEVLRAWFRDTPGRQQAFYVATKVPAKTFEWPAHPKMRIADAFPVSWITRCAEVSLKRLGLEQIDLLQLHVWTDAWVDTEEWRKASEVLKSQGKIRAFGVSVNDHEPESVLKLVATGQIDSVQVIYNIFDQSPEKALFPLVQERDVAVIARVPLDEGSLTGSFTPETRFPPGDWRSGYFKGERLAQACHRTEKLKAFLGSDASTLSSLALKFALHHSAASTVIPGMRTAEHVETNCAASDGKKLSPEVGQNLKTHAWPRNFYVGAWD